MAKKLMVAKLYRCDFQFCYGCGAKWRSAGCSCDDEEHDESEDQDDLVDM